MNKASSSKDNLDRLNRIGNGSGGTVYMVLHVPKSSTGHTTRKSYVKYVLLEYMDCGSLEGIYLCDESSLADLTRQILRSLVSAKNRDDCIHESRENKHGYQPRERGRSASSSDATIGVFQATWVPKAPPRPTVEGKEGTTKKQKDYNCKHSLCLKLYCECFASGVYRDGCNCICHKNVDNERLSLLFLTQTNKEAMLQKSLGGS
ncbi:tesmin/TSO1-like CXC 5 [Tanacetum coccineum]